MVTGVSGGGSGSEPLLNYLHRERVELSLFLEGWSDEGILSLTVVAGTEDLKRCRRELRRLAETMGAESAEFRDGVALVRLLGPHFDIKPGMASLLFGALAKAGIEVLAASTTVTSSLIVVSAEDAGRALKVLRKSFKWPGG
jgi:aspartokinase